MQLTEARASKVVQGLGLGMGLNSELSPSGYDGYQLFGENESAAPTTPPPPPAPPPPPNARFRAAADASPSTSRRVPVPLSFSSASRDICLAAINRIEGVFVQPSSETQRCRNEAALGDHTDTRRFICADVCRHKGLHLGNKGRRPHSPRRINNSGDKTRSPFFCWSTDTVAPLECLFACSVSERAIITSPSSDRTFSIERRSRSTGRQKVTHCRSGPIEPSVTGRSPANCPPKGDANRRRRDGAKASARIANCDTEWAGYQLFRRRVSVPGSRRDSAVAGRSGPLTQRREMRLQIRRCPEQPAAGR
ncbi:unnamed protein product, partial [Iphiclides podalirius]